MWTAEETLRRLAREYIEFAVMYYRTLGISNDVRKEHFNDYANVKKLEQHINSIDGGWGNSYAWKQLHDMIVDGFDEILDRESDDLSEIAETINGLVHEFNELFPHRETTIPAISHTLRGKELVREITGTVDSLRNQLYTEIKKEREERDNG